MEQYSKVMNGAAVRTKALGMLMPDSFKNTEFVYP